MKKPHFWQEPIADLDESPNDNKLIVVLSNPRSNSTVSVRIWEARHDDFVIMCEPGVLAYNKEMLTAQQRPELTEKLFEWGMPTFNEVRKTITQELQNHDVFIKDTVFAAKHYLNTELPGISSPSSSFFFLLRDPADGLVSNYKVLPISMDENLRDAWSYEHMFHLYQNIKQLNKNVHLIRSQDLINNPEETVQMMCQKAKVEYKPSCLQWDPLIDKREIGTYCRFVPNWQDTVALSSGIDKNLSQSKAKRDANNAPTFEEIPPAHREGYIEFYNEQIRYYRQLERYWTQQQNKLSADRADSCVIL
ncbi:MAG: hypothetical protein WC627_08355 [Legionella sp.]|jgi:hypothetical protein